MSTSLRNKASWLIASVGTWVFLAASVYGLTRDLDQQPENWTFAVAGPPLALLCGYRALRSSPLLGKFSRVFFWILTVTGTAFVALLFQGRWEKIWSSPLPLAQEKPEHAALLLSALAISMLVLMGLVLRARRMRRLLPNKSKQDKRWIWDLATGAVIVALLVAGWLFWLNTRATQRLDEGYKRWADIGRSMPEFAKTLKRTEENQSFDGLLADLRPFGVENLYKLGAGSAKSNNGFDNHLTLPFREAIDFYSAVSQPADNIEVSLEKAPKLTSMSGDLDRIYRNILSRPPPLWEFTLPDRFDCAAPNFLLLRQVSQTIEGDAMLRLARGDQEGAAESIAAGRRITDGLREHPILVSCMVRVAIEALFAPAATRLPENANGWEQLSRDTAETRTEIARSIQLEALGVLKFAERGYLNNQYLSSGSVFGPAPLPRWVARIIDRAMLRVEVANAWMVEAGTLDCWKRMDFLTSPDLGEKEMGQLCARYPSITAPNCARAWARVNEMLLLREQSEVLRFARAQMASGRLGSPTEHPSVVIPGAKWEIIPDRPHFSVALKLTPTPEWAAHGHVAEPHFFLLPFDGSKSWSFNNGRQVEPPGSAR